MPALATPSLRCLTEVRVEDDAASTGVERFLVALRVVLNLSSDFGLLFLLDGFPTRDGRAAPEPVLFVDEPGRR